MDLAAKTNKERWLEEGYAQFAENGPEGLSINKISKDLGVSRASFYHYFGDTDVFFEHLLEKHWDIVQQFNRNGQTGCKQLFPDLYQALSEHPVPLKFSIQLFRHRHIPAYNFLFIKTYESSAKAFVLKLFAEHYQLNQPANELYNLWLTVGETWYSRLNFNELSASTLQQHAEEIMESVVRFTRTPLYGNIKKSSG